MSEHQPDSPRSPCEKQAGLCPSQSSALGGQLPLYQKQCARTGGCVAVPAQIQWGGCPRQPAQGQRLRRGSSIARAAPGIERGSSRTLSENQATRPSSLLTSTSSQTLKDMCTGRTTAAGRRPATRSRLQPRSWSITGEFGQPPPERRNRTPACLHAP